MGYNIRYELILYHDGSVKCPASNSKKNLIVIDFYVYSISSDLSRFCFRPTLTLPFQGGKSTVEHFNCLKEWNGLKITIYES